MTPETKKTKLQKKLTLLFQKQLHETKERSKTKNPIKIGLTDDVQLGGRGRHAGPRGPGRRQAHVIAGVQPLADAVYMQIGPVQKHPVMIQPDGVA